MGSQAPLRLPIVDFSDINEKNRGTLIWNSTKTQVFQALQEYGCFEAYFDGISSDLRKSLFTSLEQLFNLPLETKLKNIPDKIFNGYIGQSKKAALYESLGIEDAESFTNLMWAHGNHEFCKSIQSYREKVSELQEIVRMMVLESLNLEKYLDEHMELTDCLVRVMKYRVPNEDESNLGLPGHADKNMMTILHENEVGGLEVQNNDGEWIKVKVSPNTFVVMAGEIFNVWTNGRLRAAVHRVVMTANEPRFSVGLFWSPKWGKIVKSPEEMVDEEHPLLFKPFDYEEFVKFFSKEENIGDKFVLKKYCGICY